MSSWTTPIGKARYPHLSEPDTKFDENGSYHVALVLSNEEAQDLIDRLESRFNDEYAGFCRERKKNNLKQADLPYSPEEDDDGNPTGNMIFRFKMRAKTSKGVDRRPLLFDAKMKPMTELIGGGSRIRVSFEPSCWFVPALGVGMSLRLRAVQCVTLVEFGGSKDPQSLGFQVEEGFESDATETASATKNDTFDTFDDADGDF